MARRKRNNHSRFSLFVFQDIITCVMGIMLLLTLMMCLQITSVVATAQSSPAEETIRQMKQQAADLSAEVATLQKSVDQHTALLNSGAINDATLLKNRSVTLATDIRLATADIAAQWEQRTTRQNTLSSLQDAEQRQQKDLESAAELIRQNQQLLKTQQELKSGNRVVYNAHDSIAGACWLVELTAINSFQAAELGKNQVPLKFSSSQDLSAWILQRHRSGAVFLLLVKPNSADILEPLTEELRTQQVVFGFDLLPQHKTAIDPATGASIQ